MECPTIKINPTDPEQGEFVVINEEDFDPAKHERYIEGDVPVDEAPAKRRRKQG